jgi:hypothetical protein
VATFRQWERLIGPYMTGVPVPALEDAVREACIEFCQRTRVDTRIKGSIEYVPEEPDTALPLVTNETTPWQCINLWTPTGLVLPKTRREIDLQYPDGFVGVTVSDTRLLFGWISLRPQLVRLVPALSVETVLRLEVCYQPKREARMVDDYLYDLFGEQISFGAMARLAEHADVPYANPAAAGGYRMRFEDAISRIGQRSAGGHNKMRLSSGGDRIT